MKFKFKLLLILATIIFSCFILLQFINNNNHHQHHQHHQHQLYNNSSSSLNITNNNNNNSIKGFKFPNSFYKEIKITEFPFNFNPLSPSSTIQAAILATYRHKYIPNTNIPLIIHQTWKSHDISLKKSVSNSVFSWKNKNPDFIHLLWDDDDIKDLVKTYYPAHYHDFKLLQKPILKADLFRYLVLDKFGGIYADVDTECLYPAYSWVVQKDIRTWMYKNTEMSFDKQISFIVGVEADVPKSFEDKWKGIYYTPLQICQWTMASAPNYPVISKTLISIFAQISGKSASEISNMDVIKLTGPAPWTSSVFWSWKAFGVDWQDLRQFGDASKVIGDQLILPITAFSPGLGQVLITMFGDMGSKHIEDPDARVRHHWSGSWR